MVNAGEKAAGGDENARYVFKSTIAAPAHELELGPETLRCQYGRRSSEVAYRDIARIRLSFRPVAMLRGRYQMEVWAASGATLKIPSATAKSLFELQPQNRSYRAFLVGLHQRLVAAGATPRLETGIHPALYWTGVLVGAALSLALFVLIGRAVVAQAWAGAAFVVGFLALFCWQSSSFFKRNQPGYYTLDALPGQLLPDDTGGQVRTTSTEQGA